MELVSTMEISGEEREIADAYARGQIATNAQNIAKNAEGIVGLNNNLANIDRTIGVEKIFNTYISSTDGSLKSSVDYITSGKINVTPNMHYSIVGGTNGTGNDNYIRVASYKADGSFISRVDKIEDFVPSLECAYIRYFITNAYYDSIHIYSNDVNNQINKNSNDIMNIKNDLSDSLPVGTILTVVDDTPMSSDMWRFLNTGKMTYQNGGALVEMGTMIYQKIK